MVVSSAASYPAFAPACWAARTPYSWAANPTTSERGGCAGLSLLVASAGVSESLTPESCAAVISVGAAAGGASLGCAVLPTRSGFLALDCCPSISFSCCGRVTSACDTALLESVTAASCSAAVPARTEVDCSVSTAAVGSVGFASSRTSELDGKSSWTSSVPSGKRSSRAAMIIPRTVSECGWSASISVYSISANRGPLS